MFGRHIFTIAAAGAGMVTTIDCPVKSIRWIGATTAGHTCVIQDSDSAILWASEAAGANYAELDGVSRHWPGGFKVPTLGSGTLYVEIDRPLYQGLRDNRG